MKDKLAEWFGRGSRKNEPEIEFKPYEEPKITEPTEPKPVAADLPETVAKETGSKLKLVRPESYREVASVADYLLEGCTVVLNLESLEKPAIIRMLDFLSGVTYAKSGQIRKSSETTYVITPGDVDVSADLD